MEAINERFRQAREKLKLSQEEFASRANRTRSEIKNIEYGKTTPKEEVIAGVCEAHDISSNWLRTGEGEMFVPKDKEREIAEFLADVASDRENSVRRQLIRIMARLPEDTWETIEQILKDFANEQKEKPSD